MESSEKLASDARGSAAAFESQDAGDPGLQALRTIRHDFKTPLTSLKMLGQIFKMSLEKGTLALQPERTERNCKLLIEQVDKLVELADDLYEISLMQSGRLRLERQLADLRPIIQNAMARRPEKISAADLPEEPIWGEWDTARLLQAFSHLISEGAALSITVRPDRKAGWVEISINGDFKPASEKSSPGRYAARVILEQHGGSLTDHFKIRLPLAPA